MSINFKEQRERNDEYLRRVTYRTEDSEEIDYVDEREYKIIDDGNPKYNSVRPILNKIK